GDILELGELANRVRERKNGNVTYFIVNRHINYTNICVNRCRFCAFSREQGAEGAYAMTVDEIVEAASCVPGRFTELHIVGGLHPDLPLSYYQEMLSALKAVLPEVHLQAFTAVEIAHMARLAGLSVRESLQRLIEAGLGSLPGGGAEVFATRVREAVCPVKLSGDDWLSVMRTAHHLGLRSNATMLYGHIETPEEKVDHLLRLRALQDETGGFMAYIPLAYHSGNTDLGGRPSTTGTEDLREVAIGRLALDNFDHVKSFWIMQGLKLAQVSLWFGADDLDGTVTEERITHAAGATTPQSLTRDELCALICEAGRVPVERDTVYNVVCADAASVAPGDGPRS
ncbi:MAG: aminofutalosine synthase MqnE, partial [Armatimonadetes bacterium]|nr:aminofutalosine synthase MqnE [Armatimonadota bacterium]